ncbi:pyridoxal-phosphate dependent enzyme [Microcoleus sp. CZ3-B4]
MTDLPGIWRYLPLIPVNEQNIEILADSSTPELLPPVDAKPLAEMLGVKSVALLPCTEGPSGTFKDVEAAVVIAKCLDWGLQEQPLSWHSTGNTARAYREYAIRAKLQSFSFFPLQCLDKWQGITSNQNHLLLAYNGSFQEISSLAKEYARHNGFLHLAPLHWKLEGKATLAYSIMENLPTTTCIVQTIAGGYGPLGMYLGLQRLQQWEIIGESLPRFELFQIEGADTISKLMPLNRDIQETDLKLPLNPFEPTLQSTNPLATFSVVRNLVCSTSSNIASVSVPEVQAQAESFEQYCREVGVKVSYASEKCPFIAWAGLMRKAKRKELDPNDEIVIIVTGSSQRSGDIPHPDQIINKKS